jgi:hypothetical protein
MTTQDWHEEGDSEAEAVLTWLEDVGLAGPAYLLLQGIRPATFFVGQGLLFVQPLLPVAGWRRGIGRFADLLSDRSRVEGFLTSLEARLRRRGGKQGKENA